MNHKFWEIKQSAVPTTIDLYIYSAVERERYNWNTDTIEPSDTSAEYFRDMLTTDITNINIYINSVGGSVMEGTAIYNQLMRHNAYKKVYIDGFACSIASVIAMSGDRVIMPKNTVMMIHNAWCYASGNAAELRKIADDLDKINEVGKQAYLRKAAGKLSADMLTEIMNNETYLTAEECIKYGLADEYGDKNVDIEQAKKMIENGKKNNFEEKAINILNSFFRKGE